MAVLEAIPGIKVTVRINGVDCPEYDDLDVPEQQLSHPTSSKYIESPDNAEFTLCIGVNKDYDWGDKSDCLVFAIRVDSALIHQPIVEKNQLANGYYERVIRGQDIFCDYTKSWFNHALKFSIVNIGKLGRIDRNI